MAFLRASYAPIIFSLICHIKKKIHTVIIFHYIIDVATPTFPCHILTYMYMHVMNLTDELVCLDIKDVTYPFKLTGKQ